MSFLSELRRRNVFKVGAAYAVLAWIIMQVADLAAPALRLPDWVTSLVLFLLLIGFPIAVFLAWAYELTPEGIRRAEDVSVDAEPAGGSRYELTIIVLLVVAIGLLIADRYSAEPDIADSADVKAVPAQGQPTLSIAVLPFTNMSEDPEQEHFADGLTEELLNTLAGIDGLRVISRTSSFAFKDGDLPLKDIAAQLDVDHILEGSVRRAGDRIRVTAQLIRTDTDAHLWSENYDRILTVENVFDVQESIAATVISELQLKLLPGSVVRSAPSNIEALDLYHDGLFYMRMITTGRSWNDETFELAISKFEAAVVADPNWVLPVAWLGRAYHFWSAGGQDREKFEKSRSYVLEAIRRDPDTAVAHQSLGYILSVDGDFEASLDAYDRAEALGARVHWGRAITLASLGRFTEAAASYRLAAKDDPLSTPVRAQLTRTMLCAGMYDELIADKTELLALFPNDPWFQTLLSQAYARTGQRTAALQYVAAVADELGSEALSADVLALLGEEDRARAAISELDERDVGLEHAAIAALVLGQQAEGLAFLERHAKTENAGNAFFLLCSPEVRALKGNPRYDALLAERRLL